MVKIYTALNKEERLFRFENLRLKFEVFMEKIFTALGPIYITVIESLAVINL